MGHDSEGTRKDGINGAGLGSNIQGGGAVVAVIWKKYIGGYQVDAQGPDRISSSGGKTYYRDDSEMWGRRRLVLPSGR